MIVFKIHFEKYPLWGVTCVCKFDFYCENLWFFFSVKYLVNNILHGNILLSNWKKNHYVISLFIYLQFKLIYHRIPYIFGTGHSNLKVIWLKRPIILKSISQRNEIGGSPWIQFISDEQFKFRNISNFIRFLQLLNIDKKNYKHYSEMIY